jgi:hypothetical protein
MGDFGFLPNMLQSFNSQFGDEGDPRFRDPDNPADAWIKARAEKEKEEEERRRQEEMDKMLHQSFTQGGVQPLDAPSKYRQTLGLQPDAKISIGQKASTILDEIRRAYYQGPKYVPLRERLKEEAQKDYELQTRRINTAIAEQKNQQLLANMAFKDRQLQSLDDWRKSKLEQENRKLTDTADYRATQNKIRQQDANTKEGRLKIDEELALFRQRFPNLNEGQVIALLSSTYDDEGKVQGIDPKAYQENMKAMQRLKNEGRISTTVTDRTQVNFMQDQQGNVVKIETPVQSRSTRMPAGIQGPIPPFVKPGQSEELAPTQPMLPQGRFNTPPMTQPQMGRSIRTGSTNITPLPKGVFKSDGAAERTRLQEDVIGYVNDAANLVIDEYKKGILTGGKEGLHSYSGPPGTDKLGGSEIASKFRGWTDRQSVSESEIRRIFTKERQQQTYADTGKQLNAEEQKEARGYWPQLSDGPDTILQKTLGMKFFLQAADWKRKNLDRENKSAVSFAPVIRDHLAMVLAKVKAGQDLDDNDLNMLSSFDAIYQGRNKKKSNNDGDEDLNMLQKKFPGMKVRRVR